MKFELTIYAGSIQGDSFPARKPALSGFDLLDAARLHSGVKNLDPDRVTSSPFGCSTFYIKVGENFARESAQFQSQENKILWATPGFIQSLLAPDFKIHKNDATGEVIRVSVEWVLDKTRFIDEWKRLGFPDFLYLQGEAVD